MNNLKIQQTCEIYTEQNMSSELKKELCQKLLEGGQLRLYDVIRHSYTKNRLNNGEKNMNRVESIQNNICPTLDTRCDCLGVVVKGE